MINAAPLPVIGNIPMVSRACFVLVFAAIAGCGEKDDGGSDSSANGECQSSGLPDAPAAAGQLVFSVDTTIDPCDVQGYVVGYSEDLTVEHADDGSHFIDNIPSGEHDVIISAGTLVVDSSLLVKKKAKRLNKQKFINGVRKKKGQLNLPDVGGITGKATLFGQTDHAGIHVYIPGTGFDATTDSAGAYTISPFVPDGINNLYFEKDGYHRGQIENITVTGGSTTTADAMELVLSTGADGFVIIQGGVSEYNSRKVSLHIGSTSDAVLMKISESSTFDNISWEAVNTRKDYTFDSDGAKTLYVKFADANGLESSPFSASITIDTTAPTFTVSSAYTIRETNMTVTIAETDVTALKMKISKSADFSSASWVDFSNTKIMPYAKVIKIQLKDAFDNESEVAEYTTTYQATLSEARSYLVGVTVGTKALFAGGNSTSGFSSVVDIYDGDTNLWSTASLSVGRNEITAGSVGNKALFAGGYGGSISNVVDIYNSSTNTWSAATLSVARYRMAVATVGTKILFAGGQNTSDVVDIYDNASGSWTTATLTVPRSRLAGTSLGTKAFFAGGLKTNLGATNVVDIYNSNTNTWSTATLSQERYNISATTVGTKAIFSGGHTGSASTNVVDIYDSTTDSWSTTTMSVARDELRSITLSNLAFFTSGNTSEATVDIYNFTTNTWSTSSLTAGRRGLGAAAVNSIAIFAGGYINSTGGVDTIDIYDLSTGIWSTKN